MFYICDEKNGKYGVKDMSDGVVDYFTSDELYSIVANGMSVLGVSVKNKYCKVLHIDEYQELDWGSYRIFSYVNTGRNSISICVESKLSNKVLYVMSRKCYLDESDMDSLSTPKNGELQWIFDEGRETKCAGVCIWLDYISHGSENSYQMCIGAYLELHKDGELVCIDTKSWNFDECGEEYVYDEERDCITVEYM